MTLTREQACARIAVALDRPSWAGNQEVLDALAGEGVWFKVGMRSFYADGRAACEAVHAAGARLFLDLKLHDIPQTVAGAMSALAPTGADLITIHASGGPEMVAAAVEAARIALPAARVVAVTALTSLDASQTAALSLPPPEVLVPQWARAAMEAGADGLVCSAVEVEAMRRAYPDAWLVVPGIRPSGAAMDDQRRVATPADALSAGATLLVVGRPIVMAPHPRTALDEIVASLQACEAEVLRGPAP